MSFYIVLSEPLEDVVDIDGYGHGPLESYAQCEVVEANTREQAREG